MLPVTWVHFQVTAVAGLKHHVPQDSLGRWQRSLEPVACENVIHAYKKFFKHDGKTNMEVLRLKIIIM